MHEGLGHDQGQQQVREELGEAIEIRQPHDEHRGDQSNERDARESGEEVGEHVRQTGDLSVGSLPPEDVPYLEEERKDRDGHENEKCLHVEQQSQERSGCGSRGKTVTIFPTCHRTHVVVHGSDHERQRDVHRQAHAEDVRVLPVHVQHPQQQHGKLPQRARAARGAAALLRRLVPLRGLPHRRRQLGPVERPDEALQPRPAALRAEIGVDDLQEKLRRVGVPRARVAMRGKVLDGDVGRGAEVDLLALRQQAQRVEEAVGPGARLVDAHDDRVALLRDVAQMLDHLHGGRGVQPRCRLVQQEDGGAMQQLDGDAEAALLASGDALDQRVSHSGLGAGQQSHLLNYFLDHLLSAVRRSIGEPRGVAQRLAHSEAREERVLLRHVADDLTEIRRMLLTAV
mmetsp:Transcript_126986/g.344781  ORF Transcript_126986/g.344781 Transcript_126986/m.344781 type:complete len:399 (-) Transcript_126986:295-1491(-)